MEKEKKDILEKLVSKIPSKWFEESEIRFNKTKKMKNNERNAGRKKKENEPYTVRCHPKVIKDVRKYAKEQSEQYLNKKQDEKTI